jgi:hypothetical protein
MATAEITVISTDGKYHPTNPVNRGAMAQFLHKIAGLPSTSQPTPRITDLAGLTSARARSIKWLAAENITVVNASTQNRFHPAKPVNRGAMAEFLYKLAGSPGSTPAQASVSPNPKLAASHALFLPSWKGDLASSSRWHCAISPVSSKAPAAHPNPATLVKEAKLLSSDRALTALKTTNPNRYYAILWLTQMHITIPTAGKYNPQNVVNRGAMAQFLRKLHDVMLTGQPAK